MAEVNIKEIEKKQIPEMVQIWNQHWKVLTSSDIQHTMESLTKWQETAHEINHKMFGLSIEEKLKAFMILHYREDGIWIKMTAVNNNERYNGYGTKLLAFAVEDSKDKSVFTEIKVENINTLNICLKKNFKIIKYRENMNEYVLEYLK